MVSPQTSSDWLKEQFPASRSIHPSLRHAQYILAGRYGSLAEIGAGQEVARWFFRVGGAAGTIAKSVSA